MGSFISRHELNDISKHMNSNTLKKIILYSLAGVTVFQLGSFALDYFHQQTNIF